MSNRRKGKKIDWDGVENINISDKKEKKKWGK